MVSLATSRRSRLLRVRSTMRATPCNRVADSCGEDAVHDLQLPAMQIPRGQRALRCAAFTLVCHRVRRLLSAGPRDRIDDAGAVTPDASVPDGGASGDAGGIALIRGRHPNLWYNQTEIDRLRRMILVDRSPTELVGVYEDEVVGKIAAAPWENDQTQRYGSDVGNSTAHTNLPDGRVDWYDGYLVGNAVGRRNMAACIWYMIEPTHAKAEKMKGVVLDFLRSFDASYYADPQACGHVNWSLAWMYDLTYHATNADGTALYTSDEKAEIEAQFTAIAGTVKTRYGNGSLKTDPRDPTVFDSGGLGHRHVHEGTTRCSYANGRAFVAGNAVIAALNGNDQALLEFVTKSQTTMVYTNPYAQGVSYPYAAMVRSGAISSQTRHRERSRPSSVREWATFPSGRTFD